tara:strand:+ start:525 stop:788 length:264 start_codon:yes stop_codon:yes gene_type:complete
MKLQTARIFIKKINNLVNEFENYISLNELLDSDSDTIHKENLKNTIKAIEDKQEATDPLRLPDANSLTDSPLDDLANIVGTKWIKGG